ncbi:ubiquitin family domain-containing protein [Ditylenchus destructor]|nr:ubiquitin family domain-containing protein [Ditylenchus destructor]
MTRMVMDIVVIVDGTTRKIKLNSMYVHSTIARVKAKIQEQANIPVEEQCLIFNDSELENDKTLKSYNVQHLSTIHLVRLTAGKIIVRVVIDGTTRKFKLSLDVFDTVAQVKAKIQKQENIPLDQQSLYFTDSELENDKTLESYGIKTFSVIRLVRLSSDSKIEENIKDLATVMKIFVYVDGTTGKIQLDMNPTSTIAEMKAKILEQENIPMKEQCLIFDDFELKNDKTLKSYGVKNRSTIRLVRLTSTKIIVFVDIDGTMRKFKLNLDASDTVVQVKAKIQTREDIPPDQQALYFQDAKLENDKTLESYGIKTLSTLRLVLKIDSKNVKRLKTAAIFTGAAAGPNVGDVVIGAIGVVAVGTIATIAIAGGPVAWAFLAQKPDVCQEIFRFFFKRTDVMRDTQTTLYRYASDARNARL